MKKILFILPLVYLMFAVSSLAWLPRNGALILIGIGFAWGIYEYTVGGKDDKELDDSIKDLLYSCNLHTQKEVDFLLKEQQSHTQKLMQSIDFKNKEAIRNLKKEYENSNNYEIDSKVAKIKAELEKKQAEELRAEKTWMQNELSYQISKIESDYQQMLKNIESNSNYTIQAQQIQENKDEQIRCLERQHAMEIQNLENQYNEKMRQQELDFAKQEAQLRATIQKKQQENSLLKNSLNEMYQKQDEYISRIQQLNEAANIPIENKAIRRQFDKAINEAKTEIDILSPWVTETVVNKSFIEKMRRLLERGVIIKIAYGIGSNSENAGSREERSEKVIDKLHREFHQWSGKSFITKRGDSHGKLFLCDDKYYVIASFNFLSFDGNYKGKDKRGEIGEYSENQKILEEYRLHYFNF